MANFLPQSEWTEDYLRARLTEEVNLFGHAHYDGFLAIDEASRSKSKRTRSVDGTASIEEISRSGLLIEVGGMDLKHFRKNPVVLASHLSIVPATAEPAVIGLVGSVAIQGNRLSFRNMKFDSDPLSEAWFQKIVSGHIRMVSVGVQPHEVDFEEKRIGKGEDARTIRYLRFVRSELVEISPTPIGANRGAFIDPTSLPASGEGVSPELPSGIDALRAEVAELRSLIDGTDPAGEAFGDASFPDAAFIVEKGAPKEDGRTPQEYRHLPHHRSTAKSATENGSVDLPHLRNALARCGQVKPAKESAESYRRRAQAHLNAHARVLLKSKSETLAALADIEQMMRAETDHIARLMEVAQEFSPTRKE